MASKRRLSSEERNFFSLVNQTSMANPFSDKRVELDLEIAGLFPDVSVEERIEKITLEVRQRLNSLEKAGKASLDHFSGRDREIMTVAFLFDFFHYFLKEVDQLILDQIMSGDSPVKVPYADEAVSMLKKRGFALDEIPHFIALCFQLRRAFYFIDHGLVGRSPCMKKLRESLWNNVFTHDLDLYNRYLWNSMEDFSTLILGETGTGKGAAAMAIGRSGFIPYDGRNKCFAKSFTSSFISINLSQFSENLIESELFGHKKGAFTGAVDDHQGVFDRCSPHGAIFLDEIGEVPGPLQIKLLKVLEERSYSPVGSHMENRFEGRVIAATNRPADEIQSGALLRDDFFYRLCSDIIMVPPLRLRIEEDPGELDDLLTYTVERITGVDSPELVNMVKKEINRQPGMTYTWPGNVRELGQCVRRILLNRRYRGVAVPALSGAANRLSADMEGGNISAQDLIRGYCRMLYDKFGTYGEVARRTMLDRRTVKKYIDAADNKEFS